jgi:hypothetical protein
MAGHECSLAGYQFICEYTGTTYPLNVDTASSYRNCYAPNNRLSWLYEKQPFEPIGQREPGNPALSYPSLAKTSACETPASCE